MGELEYKEQIDRQNGEEIQNVIEEQNQVASGRGSKR